MRRYLYEIMMDQRQDILARLIKFILWLLSFIYRFGILCRNGLYKISLLPSHKLPKPVISVGNMTWGGVGKTPLVIEIAKFLRSRDLKVAILLRGYMQEKRVDGFSDEAVMLKNSLEDVIVASGKNRVASARKILKEQVVDAFLLDDGFQHDKIKRDLDIVAIDATNPFGNGHCIPRGILREPISALKRADMVVITKSDWGKKNVDVIKNKIRRIKRNMPIFEAVHCPQYFYDLCDGKEYDLDFLTGKKVFSFASIGDPRSFCKTLTSLGVNLVHHFSFMDHHRYVDQDIDKIMGFCGEQKIQYIVTTQKDAVKLNPYCKKLTSVFKCLVLNIKLDLLEGKDGFINRISHIL